MNTLSAPLSAREDRLLRLHINGLRTRIYSYVGNISERSDEDVARAAINWGGQVVDIAFALLDLIGRPELKEQFVADKVAFVTRRMKR